MNIYMYIYIYINNNEKRVLIERAGFIGLKKKGTQKLEIIFFL